MVEIASEPLDVARLIASVRTNAHGAVVTFLGVVRETTPGDDRAVEALTYEAYVPMAVEEMEAIVDEAQKWFGDARVAIAHRVGVVPLGEASVAVAAAAAHRAVAFDACEYAIDQVKLRVPIWKQERYGDGTVGWRENAR